MLVVSQKFEHLSKLEKQRLVYASLGDLMTKIHALTLTCMTEEELKSREANESPGCVSGKGKEKEKDKEKDKEKEKEKGE